MQKKSAIAAESCVSMGGGWWTKGLMSQWAADAIRRVIWTDIDMLMWALEAGNNDVLDILFCEGCVGGVETFVDGDMMRHLI